MKKVITRGFSKTSVFGKATLDLNEKSGFRPIFQEPFPKLTEFWKWLTLLIFLFFCCNCLFSQIGNFKAMDRSDDAIDKMYGLIPMRFFNALNRTPISEATIEIANIGNFTTNVNGKISFPVIPDGNYTMVFYKEGYITTSIDFVVLMGGVDLNWYSISPGFSNAGYRIVLEWGERPADLDINLTKIGGSGDYHISYRNMRAEVNENTTLDRDDTNGYGPETITIGVVEENAVYNCFVNDYSNRNNVNSNQMAQRGAIIRVYRKNTLVQTFRIPSDGIGVMWNVFIIDRGLVVPINTVSSR